jgi:hypothetical protein
LSRRTFRKKARTAEIHGLPAGRRRSPNHAAGDFRAGIPGGLRHKVIRVIMDNHRSADHLVHHKAAGQAYREREPVVPEQRRQVSGVTGMLTAVYVVMLHGVGKRLVRAAAAIGPLVNVESKDLFLTGAAAPGKAADLGADNHALIGLEKPYHARNIRIALTACDAGSSLRPAAQGGEKMGCWMAAGGWLVHMKNSLSSAFYTISYAEESRRVRREPGAGRLEMRRQSVPEQVKSEKIPCEGGELFFNLPNCPGFSGARFEGFDHFVHLCRFSLAFPQKKG